MLEWQDFNFDVLWPMSVAGARGGVGWTTLHSGERKAETSAEISGGYDGEMRCNMCYSPYRREVSSLYIKHARQFSNKRSGYINALIEYHSYDERFFDMYRRDYRGEVAIGLTHKVSKTWSLQPKLHLINQQSSVDLFDFRRAVFVFSSRWAY